MARLIAVFGALLASLAFSNPQDPVRVSAFWKGQDNNAVQIQVGLDVEEKGFRIFRDTVRVEVPGCQILKNELPKGEPRFDPFTKQEKEVFLKPISWLVVASKSGTEKKLESVDILVTYRACNSLICLFPKTKKLHLSSETPSVHASVFGSIGQFWELLTHVNADRVKDIATKHIWIALLLCFASGILTSLTPCVYPMIPITINIFGRFAQSSGASSRNGQSFNWKTFSVAGIYVAGMCTTYSIMGLIAGMTGSLFGRILQSSFVLAFLCLLFLILSLGQLGVFKMALPASWQTKLSSVGDNQSRLGIFMMGLFSGLIVSPCVGPVIAGILAFVFDSSNAVVGLLYFLSFSLGIGVLFLLIGGFSGFLAALPRSGAWMVRVNRLLATLLLIASGYYGLLWLKQAGLMQRTIPVVTTEATASIPWMSDEQQALAIAAEKHHPIMIDFTAEWCEACHEMEATLFHEPSVIQRLTNFIPLRIDVTKDTAENLATLKKYGIVGLPTLVFVTPRGKILSEPRINGTVSTDEFLTTTQSVLNLQ